MVPRGEVGLIFAAIGSKLVLKDGSRVITESTYSAVVIMVIITTMITPPLLKWSLNRNIHREETDKLKTSRVNYIEENND